MPAINHRINRLLKALEAYGKNEWITDADLGVLAGEATTDTRDTMNSACTSVKYEGVLERDGSPGAWRYRLIGDIDWATVGTRAGSKNGHKARQLAPQVIKWAQGRGTRSAFTRQQIMRVLNIDMNQARPTISRLVQKGDLIVMGPDSWRLADHIELVEKKPASVGSTQPMVDPYVPVAGARHTVTVVPLTEEAQVGAASLSAAIKAMAEQPAKKTMEQCIDDALLAIVDDAPLTGEKLKRVLPMALAFQRQCEALYKAIREA